ncbi:MAG: CBS domain-containing protein [Candidatus Thermoplasmatota archaeon]|jgi:signal-transduction protein with cAMP-binding, CBS, and nucleotidyltransferase domain|nr:CBS domain-containing protein [Candidatus Thermoplasmatota archaeon]
MAKKKVIKKSVPTGAMKDASQMRVKDLVITDEFKKITHTSSGKDAAGQLMAIPRGVVLAIDDAGSVKGVLTAREFLKAIVDGKNPTDTAVTEMMNTDVMEIPYDSLLDDVVPEVTKRDPYAVVVVDADGVFKGYFSPKDYQEALARINYRRSR